MKKIIFTTLTAGILAFTSCQKQNNVSPVSSSTATTAVQKIAVDYKIHAASGNFSFEYTMPDVNGKPQVYTGTSNKMDQTFSFSWEKYKTLSVKATNTNPSGDEVDVDIYVDGTLLVSGKANHPAAWAIASAEAK